MRNFQTVVTLLTAALTGGSSSNLIMQSLSYPQVKQHLFT